MGVWLDMFHMKDKKGSTYIHDFAFAITDE
jgi:hypothetical protein